VRPVNTAMTSMATMARLNGRLGTGDASAPTCATPCDRVAMASSIGPACRAQFSRVQEGSALESCGARLASPRETVVTVLSDCDLDVCLGGRPQQPLAMVIGFVRRAYREDLIRPLAWR
jgi:hypothetical protein